MVRLRLFDGSDADYSAIVEVASAVWPNMPVSADEWKHYDEAVDPQYFFARLLAENEGRVVGNGVFMEPFWSHRPGKYYIDIEVHPDFQNQGIGTRIYDEIVQRLAERNPMLFVSSTREDQPGGIHFLEQRGYQCVMREPVSELDVQAFDVDAFRKYIERVVQSGYKIVTLRELLATDPNALQDVYELNWTLEKDIPHPEPPTKPTFEAWRKLNFERPGYLPDAWFIAMDGDQLVGLSRLWTFQSDPQHLDVGITGVIPSHRRQGIAMALKVRGIEFAKAYGATEIRTGNEENNPMYQINLRLGFKPMPAWLSYEKSLTND
jgi:GNAT superfamily N-acetyltransferase